MQITDPKGRTSERSYLLNSNEHATRWEKLNTSVWKGKMKLVQVALDTMIPDIQESLSAE
jgi:hypothetical protein